MIWYGCKKTVAAEPARAEKQRSDDLLRELKLHVVMHAGGASRSGGRGSKSRGRRDTVES